MAERRRALDQLRDRSGRQRDGEAETDSQRRVRERHEDEGGVQQHADVEAARRQARRRKKQEAWVRDVGAFAAVFEGWAPRHWTHDTPMSITEAAAKGMRPRHPFAYNGFRQGFWLRDGTQIVELHGFMQRQPPTGDEEWESDVDACARRLWRTRVSIGTADDSRVASSLPLGRWLLHAVVAAECVAVHALIGVCACAARATAAIDLARRQRRTCTARL